MRWIPLVTVAPLFLLACAGKIDPNDKSGATDPALTEPGSAPKDGTPAGDAAKPPPPPTTCGAKPAMTQTMFSSQADMLAHLGGAWRSCGDNGKYAFGGPTGFEVTPDGRFYVLDVARDGQLVRKTGFRSEGQFVAVSNGQGELPYAEYADGSFRPMFASFSSDGASLGFYDEAGQYTYARTGEPVAVPPIEPPMAREGAAGCANAETAMLTPATEADARQLLIGNWQSCGGATFLPQGTVGVSFAADGTWTFVGASPSKGGTYSLLDVGKKWDGSPSFQLNLTLADGSGLIPAHFAVSASPLKLWLTSEGGDAVFSAR